MDPEVKHRLLIGLRALTAVVGQLSRLYDEHEELNDQVDISQIVPMSLDDWEVEIDAKIYEIENMA